MATSADLIRAAVQQSAAGEKVDSATLDSENPSPLSSGVEVVGDDDNERSVQALESTVDEDWGKQAESEDAPADSSKADSSEPKAGSKPDEKAAKTSSDVEVITVSDDKGRRKIKVDWNNKEKLKQYVQMAYGARKWQAERDQATQALKERDARNKERDGNWDLMNKVFAEQGEEGLIDLLRGKRGAYRELIKSQVEREKLLERASPEEIEALQAREAQQTQARELDRIRKENEEFKKQVTEERERSEMGALQSKVNPVFDKYRFADKLGDPDDEQMFDEMLWTSALKRLEPYEEQGLDITPELVEREFKTVASAIRKRVGIQAERKASKAIEQKKQEATENVQAKVMSGYKSSNSAKEARDMIDSGNLTGLLKQWNKYGGLFRK